jgi:hypothetical protein
MFSFLTPAISPVNIGHIRFVHIDSFNPRPAMQGYLKPSRDQGIKIYPKRLEAIATFD